MSINIHKVLQNSDHFRNTHSGKRCEKGLHLKCSRPNENIEFLPRSVMDQTHGCKVPQEKCFLFLPKAAQEQFITAGDRLNQMNKIRQAIPLLPGYALYMFARGL